MLTGSSLGLPRFPVPTVKGAAWKNAVKAWAQPFSLFWKTAGGAGSTNFGGLKMKKTKITLKVGSTEDFFNRLREHAKKLDRGEVLPPGITITFEDPEDLLEIITSERVRLLRRVKGEPQHISALAAGLKRDV